MTEPYPGLMNKFNLNLNLTNFDKKQGLTIVALFCIYRLVPACVFFLARESMVY